MEKHRAATRPALAAYYPPTKDESEEISVAFEVFQKDRSGCICYYDCKSAVKAMGFSVKKKELLQIISQVCHNQDGENITWDEFISISMRFISRRSPQELLQRDFGLFDTQGKGFIDIEDVRRLARNVEGNARGDAELRAMIAHFDSSKSGRLDIDDFGNAMGRSLSL